MKNIRSTLSSRTYLTPSLTIFLLLVLLGITFITVIYRTREEVGSIIADEIVQLTEIFERIDEKCDILSFDYQKNPINFLTIKKDGFVGSEVGSMHIMHPENWQGPYAQNNPVIEGKEYEIIHTYAGYFIVPGTGVKLPNGKIIGKDLILDEKADIFAFMRDESALLFEGRALAAPLIITPSSVENETLAEELV